MKRALLVLLAALLISSCGANRGSNHKEAELTVVLLEVSNDLEKRGVDTSKIYREVDSWEFDNSPYYGVNGRCDHAGTDIVWNMAQADTGNHAYINRYHWDSLDSLQKKALIAHEVVGHCAWNKGHEPYGIMYEHAAYVPNQNGYDNLMDKFALTLK